MKTAIKVLVRTEIRDATTGAVKRMRKARPNLVFDSGLTALATGAINFATIFTNCKIGSSNAANSIPGNTATFTQVGTTITASAAFFTGAMVGAIFKYGTGTGGAEQYIASIGGGGLTAVMQGAGMTVATPTAGTVWLIAQTALTTPLTALTGGCVSNTYVTSPGACATTFPGGASSTQITNQRTYQFPVQAAPYTVNEIGYSDNNTNAGTCNGRIVLASPDVIAITEYYVVQIAITFTLSPNVPTAVINVGTGLNTAGNIQFQVWDCQTITSGGVAANYQASYPSNVMDGANIGLQLVLGTVPPLNANISQSQIGLGPSGFASTTAALSNASLGVGLAQATITFNFSTAGQTCSAICFGHASGTFVSQVFVLALTTPFALPSGTFQGNLVYQRAVTRTLSN